MEQTVLEQLYYGNINPNAQRFDPNSQYARFLKTVAGNEQTISDYLGAIPGAEQQQHLFSEMINAQSEISNFSERERFLEGFRLGARLMLDTFLIPRNSAISDIC